MISKKLLYLLILVTLVDNVEAIPNVWITEPSPTDFGYEPNWKTAVISQDYIKIKAVDIAEENIVSTLFEYSVDQNSWINIGTDNYGGFDGIMYFSGEDNKFGDEGWSILWDLSTLPEGDYFIRATMTNSSGDIGDHIRKVHLDRIPPKPNVIQPLYGGAIKGIVNFNSTTDADNVVSTELLLFHGSDGLYTQNGIGNTPQGQPGYCAPTAAGNALAGQGDDRIYPPGQTGNVPALIQALAQEMNTTENGTDAWENVTGTQKRTDNIGSALASYLQKRGVGSENNKSGYQVKTFRTTLNYDGNNWVADTSNNEINFKKYNDEIRKNQSVIFWFSDFEGYPPKISGEGHAVTGQSADTDTSTNPDGGNNVGYVDPVNGQSQTTSWFEGGNMSYVRWPPGGPWHVVLGMWAISPKNTTNGSISGGGGGGGGGSGWGYTTPIGKDKEASDGWSIPWNSSTVEDGYYTFITQMTDSDGYISTDTTVIEVDNTLPFTLASFLGDFKYQSGNIYWFASPINVHLLGIDGEGSGIDRIEYRLSTDGLWNTYTDIIPINVEGDTILQYRAIDNAGNYEHIGSYIIRIDTNSPCISSQIYPCAIKINYNILP